MSSGFDPDILAKFDLSRWTPIATRQRAWCQDAGPRRWVTVEGAPFNEPQAQAGRVAGLLLTALRCDQETETLVVKTTEQAREALATPVLPTRSHRRRAWYE
jgi:hypothetical protein